ncbi:MAG: DUF4091 domain-containing protein [Phycisphaerae bacterium]|nr:DUF4091 domain-containing protein [Phycisphaerae bacterium]
MVSLTDRTKPFDDRVIYKPETSTIELFSAANETVSFQLVIDGGLGADLFLTEGVQIRFSDLFGWGSSQISGSAFSAFRAMPVRVTKYPAWYLRLVDAVPKPATFYDALVPMDRAKGVIGKGLQAPFLSGRLEESSRSPRMVIWVDLAVPGGAAAGDYKGSVTISCRSREDWTVAISLKVYAFVLPDARPIAAVGGFDHEKLFGAFIKRDGRPFVPVRMDRKHPLVRRGLVLMRQLMRLGHAHRLDLFARAMHPLLKRDMFGKVRLDWSDYDAIVLPYVNGEAFADGLGCPAWPVPFSEDWPRAKYYGGFDGEAYVATAGELLSQCSEHFQKVIDEPGKMFVWPDRGVASAAAYERHIHLARIVRAVEGDFPILAPLPLKVPKLTGWQVPDQFSRLVDILAPQGQYMDPAAGMLKRGQNPLAGMWFSPGKPPYTPSLDVIATGADARAIPWFAMRYKCTGLFLPEVMHWAGDPFSTAAGAETRLFYPGSALGRNDVLPSVRLKRLRRGLQDIAYLWLLQQRRRGQVAESIAGALARYAGLAAAGDNYLDPRLDGWVQDRASWGMARRLMAEEIHAAIHPSEVTNDRLMARRLDWRVFEEKTHTVRIEQVRTRVAPARAGRGMQAVVLLELYNEFRRDVDVIATIDKLPDGWRAVRGKARILSFPAASRQVLKLVAGGDHVPAGPDGKMPLPVSVSIDRRWHKKLAASVPFITAGRVGRPVRIDGHLDEWPIRTGSAAGQFRLIGRRGRTVGKAVRQTVVQVLCDDKNLYVSFRCQEPNMAGLVARADNMVHYEQLMACGEDLVEVILDPGARAATPEELFHIVVKPNGVLLAECGIRGDMPLGASRPWPAGASAAVRKAKDLWTVELAIPLSAFGRRGQERFWGVNFARFATADCESSSWSGAPRYFYDPRNLGTMFVPQAGGKTPSTAPAP